MEPREAAAAAAAGEVVAPLLLLLLLLLLLFLRFLDEKELSRAFAMSTKYELPSPRPPRLE